MNWSMHRKFSTSRICVSSCNESHHANPLRLFLAGLLACCVILPGMGPSVALGQDDTGTDMNPGHNGAWLDSSTPGQGFLLDVMPDTNLAFLAWFTYDTTLAEVGQTAQVGHPGHRWLTAQGPIEGNSADLIASVTSDGLFDNSRAVSTVPAGTITLTFDDCSSGTVDYQLTSAGLSGQIPITRIVQDNVAMCQSLCGEIATEASGKQFNVLGLDGGTVDVIDSDGNISRLVIPEGVLVGSQDHRIEASPLSSQTVLPTGHSAIAGIQWTSQPGTLIGPATLKFFTAEAERFTELAAFYYGYQGENFHFSPLLPNTTEGVVLEVATVTPGVTGLAFLTAAEMQQWPLPDSPPSARYKQQMAIVLKQAAESAQLQQIEVAGSPVPKVTATAADRLLEEDFDLGELVLPYMKQWFDDEVSPLISTARQGCEAAESFVSAGIEWLATIQQFGLEEHSELQGRLSSLASAMNNFAAAAAQDIAALDRQCDAEPDPCKQMEIMQEGAVCAQTVQYIGADDAIAELACQDAPAMLSVSPRYSARCVGSSVQFYANVRNLKGDALPVDQFDLLWLSETPQLLSVGAQSGLAETLAPGPAWVTASSEVCGQTMEGSALLTIDGVPNIAGSYSMAGSETWRGCLDPEDNGIYGIGGSASFTIVSENEQAGTAQFSGSSDGSGFGASFSGTVRCGGAFSGSGSYSEDDGTSGSTSFNGTFSGSSFRMDFTAQDLSGDTCSSSGWVRGSK